MAEVGREFRSTVTALNGRAYRARACGAEARDGTQRWHGWIEFVDRQGTPTIRTQREITQRNRTGIVCWANGLTRHYLEGALRRALNPIVVRPRQSSQTRSRFEAPAADFLVSPTSVGG